ncbi:MAG: uncharacterized protein KVP18_003160 [Porospora cf. gigantea A]|nr:MAG: hypothetical protein KVP18_003160 [Porospora cf. gigantea A]
MRKNVNNMDIKQIRIEIDTLKLLDHPNVLKVYDIYNNNDKFYVIMENCRGDEFGKRFDKMFANNQIPTEAYVNEMMHQILSALNYIHAHKVVHKDLKPQNILFIDESPGSEIKIIDFGLAEHFASSDDVLTRVAGSTPYMAPEVFTGEYDKRCDLWSVGCIMYYISTWRQPFMGPTREDIVKKVCKAKPDYSLVEHLSPVAQDFLRRLLVKNPRKRMDAPTALAHEWFERFRRGKRSALRRDLTPAIRQNLEIFTKFPPLKAALVNLMAHQLPHNSQVQHITQVFHHLDSNEDGVLSEAELSQGLTYCRFPTWSVVQILRTLDIDDSRSVSYTEFLAACYTWMDIDLKHLWSAFMRFDRDGNGKIELHEFKEIMGCSQHGRAVPDDKIRAMFREIDIDDNGVIEWKELEEYISS